MPSHICIIDGHPDPAPHFLHSLCDAYEAGAHKGGHHVERVSISQLDIPFFERPEDFVTDPPPHLMREREKIAKADHVVFVFPLWLGSMPAKLKAFLEQIARGEFFLGASKSDKDWPTQLMKGKSARVFVSMGMPGLVYRFVMDAGALKALERALLGVSGFKPINHTIMGGIGAVDDDRRKRWLDDARRLGEGAQ